MNDCFAKPMQRAHRSKRKSETKVGMVSDKPQIGDMDECIVEGSKDAGNAKDVFTYGLVSELGNSRMGKRLAFSDLRAKRDILGGGAFDLLLGRHLVQSGLCRRWCSKW